MVKKKEFSEKEIARREADITNDADEEALRKMRDNRPQTVEKIAALLEVGRTPAYIGWLYRQANPHLWPQSKVYESVARALRVEAEA